MDNKKLITKALDRPALTRMGHRQQLELAESLAHALEAAEAELTRRASVTDEAVEAAARAMALVDNDDGCFERLDLWNATAPEDRWQIEEPQSYDEEATQWWRKRARAALAAAPVSLEAVSPSAERVRDFCDGWYSARIHRDIAAATHSPDLVRLGISDEAVKAETTTEWNAVRQDATGELWDVYEPFDCREDAERVAAEWRGNNEPGDDPVVLVERTKGVAPGEWQIVSSEVKRG